MNTCTCYPCTSPGNGGPVPGHCAACCGRSGIAEYDHGCPVPEHRELAVRQFGPLPTAPTQPGTSASEGGLSPRVCTDPECTIPRRPGRPMHGPHDFRAGECAPPPGCGCLCHQPGGMAVSHLAPCCYPESEGGSDG